MNPFPVCHWSGGPAVFNGQVAFILPLIDSLIPSYALGSYTPTYSSGGPGLVADWENILRRTKVGEARFTGARRVENLIAGSSEDLTNASWNKDNSGTASVLPVVTANFATDPLGGNTASRLQLNKGTDLVSGFSRAYQSVVYPVAGARQARTSIWLKANSGTPTVTVHCASNIGSADTFAVITLTSSWQRIATPVQTLPSTATTLYTMVWVCGSTWVGTTNSQTADILVWGAQMENISGQSNQNPSEYVSVGVLSSPWNGCGVDGVKYSRFKNDNTVSSNIVTTVTPSVLITTASGGSSATCDAVGPFGLLYEINQSNTGNITNETGFNGWSIKNNVTVTEKAAVCPTGETLAALLIEDGTTNYHYIGNFGSVSSSQTIVQSCFVKAGTQTTVGFRMDPGGGHHVDTNFDLPSATMMFQTVNGTSTGLGGGVIAYPNGWYRCWGAMSFAVSTAGGASMSIFAKGTIGGSYVGINGATALYLWGANIQGSPDFNAMPSSYAAGSRGVDSLIYSFAGNASATVGTAYCETKVMWSLGDAPGFGTRRHLISFGADATIPTAPLYTTTGDVPTDIRAGDGTNSVKKTGATNARTGMTKMASSWTGSTLNTMHSGSVQTGTFDGNMGSVAIGIGEPTTYNGSAWMGNIRNVNLYTNAATVDELPGVGPATPPAFVDSPTFSAALMCSLQPSIAGSATPTFTRASNTGWARYHDWEGFVRWGSINQARFVGARCVQNLARFTELMTNAAWVKTNCTATATTLTATAANATALQAVSVDTTLRHVLRVRMSRVTGTGNVDLTGNGGTSWTTVVLTSTPQVFSISQTPGAANIGVRLVASGDVINVDQWQYEELANGQSNLNPSEYVSRDVLSTPWHYAGLDGFKYFCTLNGTTVSGSNVVTDAVGLPINLANGGNPGSVDAVGPLGYLSERSIAGSTQRSEEFDNAWWTKGNVTITANATDGPDGTFTADKLVEAAGSNVLHYVQGDWSQGINLYSAFSVYAKAAERSWVYVAAYDSTGTTYGAYFDLVNGVIGTVAPNYFAQMQKAANGFYRCIVSYKSAAGGNMRQLVCVANGDMGVARPDYTGTAGMGIYIWGACGEINGLNNGITSYIQTTNGNWTRSKDVLTYPASGNVSSSTGTVYAEVKTSWNTRIAGDVNESKGDFISFDTVNLCALYVDSEAATTMRIRDGTNTVSKTDLTDTSTAVRKRASSWGPATIQVTGDGSAPAVGTFDGSMNIVGVGIGVANVGTGQAQATIRNVKLWTRPATNVDLTLLTA